MFPSEDVPSTFWDTVVPTVTAAGPQRVEVGREPVDEKLL
jgi:hypothetical protein